MKKELLSRILEQDARERLGRIAIVKPEKASAVESMLINMARSGRLRGKVSEDDLIGLLERINDETQKQTRIVFNRKGFDDESEEEEYDF
ncbi:hypothetical protein EV182_001434 [Spiromyces aspiralis]|uniref:Uncharacterized protein n=1 Tax=Spiromyces aspiralis TaxID=68401 RepID=A0ACC1HIZ7_9FUNG|nr:hypothetical protein EV182_001434 [Spiromyces aspiralis]